MRLRPTLLASACLSGALGGAVHAQDLPTLARQGRDAMAAGRFDEAAALYARIVDALPGEPGMRLNLGMALSMSGRPAEALEHLQTAVELRPDLLPAWLFIGTAYLDMGQPEAAVAPLERVIEAQPDNVDVRERLAHAVLATRSFWEAAHHFAAAARHDARRPGVWYGLGQSYEGIAAAALEDLRREAPDSPEGLVLAAEHLAATGRDDEALRLYAEVLEKRPGMAGVHEAMAGIYERQQRPDAAASEREKARGAPAPDCSRPTPACEFDAGRYEAVLEAAREQATPEARLYLARAAGELARQAFTRLSRLPPSPEVALLDADVRLAQSQPATEIVAALRSASARWPNDPRIGQQLVRLLLSVDDGQGALKILDEMLERTPDSPRLLRMKGESWLKLHRPDKAIPPLERAASLDPSTLSAQASLGQAYMEMDQPAAAVTALEAALPTDRDGSLYLQLGRAYRSLGDEERASRALAEYERRRAAYLAETEGGAAEPRRHPGHP